MTDGLTITNLTQQVQSLIDRSKQQADSLSAWLGGSANGGPNNDGRYPLKDLAGRETLVPSPAMFNDMVSGPAAQADVAKVSAELARDDAIHAASRSDAQRILSEAARGAAVDARNLAQEHRNHAGTHEANARYWAELAQGSGQGSADDRAVVEQLASETADNAALAAQDAQDAAASAALAATFDPALFDRKADLLSADRITGVLPVDRIPVLPSQRQFASSGGLANLTTAQQAEIGQGSIVTTTDGFRYVYSGEGSKTLATSYVILADTTPEWSSISGRPSVFTPAAHTQDWSTITGKPAIWDSSNFDPNSKANIATENTFTASQTFKGLVPIRVQQSASTGAGWVDLAGVSANSSGSVVFRDADFNRRGYIGNASATTLNIVADVPNIALNRRPTFAGNLAWDAGNFNPANYMSAVVANWLNTTDGKPRFYFQRDGRTFVRGHAGIEFRNTNDTITARIEEDGNVIATGAVYAGSGQSFRTQGSGGFVFDTYGGGWHMTDTTWLRSYAGKNIYTSAIMRADQGFYVGDARQPIFTISQAAPSGGADGDVHIVW